MELENTEISEDIELVTQEYSVLITDSKHSSKGSGVLYYPGKGPVFYVFTCAHVIEELNDEIEIKLLLPRDRMQEDYQECTVKVNKKQVRFSPIDEVTKVNGVVTHSVDAAIIYVKKNEEMPLNPTQYFVAEAKKGDKVFAQGFPGDIDEQLLHMLDTAHGKVHHSSPGNKFFTFRIEDQYLDAGNRIYELQGFSGSPIWNSNDAVLSVFGLLMSGAGENAYRGRVNALKMTEVRGMMKTIFNVVLETRITAIPEEDVAGGEREVCFDGTVIEEAVTDNIYDEWLERETEKVKSYIDDLKFEKAISTAKEAISDTRFDKCSSDIIRKHLQHLLYCCEVCYMDDEFSSTEKILNERGLLNGHDPLRWMTLNFGRKQYAETKEYAHELLEKNDENKVVLQMAEVFSILCKAYTEKSPVEDTLLLILDEHEKLLLEDVDRSTEALIYQMAGYVYGDCYKNYTKSVRCLNRSYRIGYDMAVLETLAGSYYFLALQGAIREDDTVDMEKVDRGSLYKARECFLIIYEKADEFYKSVIMRRQGILLYNTFYFLHDNYRVLTTYPLLRKYMPSEDEKDKRDIELKYTRILCEGGRINLKLFDALTDKDKILIDTIGTINEFMHPLTYIQPALLKRREFEQSLKNVINMAENNINYVEEREQAAVICQLINLYGWGHRIFGWNVAEEMERHVNFFRNVGDEKAVVAFENFIFENSHPLEEAEQKFIETWKQKDSLEFWQELLQFYKRNWMLEKADALFADLFDNHPDYIKDEPEYAYRAYIEYITSYQRNIKDALIFYLKHKNEMQDHTISEFWESELMIYTNSFNEPEKFEINRREFVEQGLVTEQEYHRISLIAYMCNLNSEKASEHYDQNNPLFGIVDGINMKPLLTKEGAHYLIWQKRLPPHMEPDWDGMLLSKIGETENLFSSEKWHRDTEKIGNKLKVAINRAIAIDAWGLFFIAAKEDLDILSGFDEIYVTHCTVSRILDEMCHYKNPYLESVIAYLEIAENITIISPDFEHQLQVREKAQYYEPESTIAIAVEKECPAIIGEPLLGQDVIDNFLEIIVRPAEIKLLV